MKGGFLSLLIQIWKFELTNSYSSQVSIISCGALTAGVAVEQIPLARRHVSWVKTIDVITIRQYSLVQLPDFSI